MTCSGNHELTVCAPYVYECGCKAKRELKTLPAPMQCWTCADKDGTCRHCMQPLETRR